VKSDDEDNHNHEAGDGESQTLLANSGILSVGGASLLRRSKNFRRKLLRRLSLGLAIYGLVVMITCLIMNTFFLAAH
jgi:hypothetical protein